MVTLPSKSAHAPQFVSDLVAHEMDGMRVNRVHDDATARQPMDPSIDTRRPVSLPWQLADGLIHGGMQMRCTLKTLLTTIAVAAALCCVFFTLPSVIAVCLLGFAWILIPPALIAGIVYGRG